MLVAKTRESKLSTRNLDSRESTDDAGTQRFILSRRLLRKDLNLQNREPMAGGRTKIDPREGTQPMLVNQSSVGLPRAFSDFQQRRIGCVGKRSYPQLMIVGKDLNPQERERMRG